LPIIEKERLIDTKTEYINRDGVLLKKVTSYSVVSGATFRDANENDEPSLQEARNLLLGKDKHKSTGYVVPVKSETISSK